MFSVPDILVVSILALLLFGPDRLPKVMRQAGRFIREVQNTSHAFVAEMERAADTDDPPSRWDREPELPSETEKPAP
jgi:TatA/E family protein of Tat protein translocase